MGTVNRFEDLIAWQKARVLTRDIYAITRSGFFARDFGLKDQIQRASVSVMSNLAEGFERGKRTEFHQFACTAKGSCGEVRSDLYVALDAGYIQQEAFDNLYGQCDEVGRIIGGLRISLERPGARRR
jgi:four helix bundle protein